MTVQLKIAFYFQYIMGRLTVVVTAPLILLAVKIAGYRIHHLDQVRRQVRELMTAHPGPWLICANHLTLIDSVILAHAMIPAHRYMADYKCLPWNVPEQMNFNRNLLVGLICFLTKCIPLVRGGDRGRLKSTLAKCNYLLTKGENLMIFPEGTRSRSGRVNTKDFPYGAGRFFCTIPGCRVMAVYLRGDNQHHYTRFPRYKENFYIKIEECFPKTDLKGLRAQRECAAQIIRHLAAMENFYFSQRSTS